MSVYLDYPDFTFCFEYTVLIWIPCCLILFGSPLWVYMITKENTKFKINISWLIILKTILIVLLIIIEIIHLIIASLKQTSYLVFYLTPSILLVTYLFVLFIIHLERSNGWKNSSLIFLFWLFLSFNSTITLRTKIIQQENNVLFYIYYCLIIIMVILSTLSEKYVSNENDLKNQSPEESSNLLSRLTFFWINPLIKTGYKRDLVREDLWKISDKEGSKSTSTKLENVWSLKANNYIKQMRQLDTTTNNNDESFIYTKDEQEKLKLNNANNDKQETLLKISQPSLTLAMIKIYFGKFTGIVAIKLTHDILNFVRPILLE